MSRFEILCVTMHQNDFSKIQEMNIHSNVVFANQCDHTSYEEMTFDGHTAKMISTNTRGVGINRNLTLSYASGDICLFADDDVVYHDDMEERILAEFDAHPDADVFIFHLDTTDPVRKQVSYRETKKCGPLSRMPWGGVRIAFRLSSIRKANLWFTTLFGGGCVFPNGEDSIWLAEAKRKGLTFYVSSQTIGTVSFGESSWFTGYDEKFFYGKGACTYALHGHSFGIWKLYYLFRCRKAGQLPFAERAKWMERGREGYRRLIGYQEYCKEKLLCNK